MKRGRIAATAWLTAAMLAPQFGAAEEAAPIQDNSFLVEEAYNQAPGVVQHISQYQESFRTHTAAFTFTQEWPVSGVTHQLSYTLPLLRGSGEAPRLGDIALNYRYQLIGDDSAAVACAPRLTVMLPTGNASRGDGEGTVQIQTSLPGSFVLSRRWSVHANLGATAAPHARNSAGDRADLFGLNAGASVIYFPKPEFNVLLEAVWSRGDEVSSPGRHSASTTALVSPGIRWAYDFSGGLQVVPGIAAPIGVGVSRRERAVILYLSFEHPFVASAEPKP